jgi:hypothetical protein
MNKLDQATCYLSGSIEAAKDGGVSWRQDFIKSIENANLKIQCIDPTNKPGDPSMKIGENKEYQNQLQANGRFEELQQYVTNYRRFDLRFTDISDFIVAAIDPSLHLCGTYDEVFLAERQKKPRFAICKGGLYKLPRWLFGVFKLEDVFEDINGVIERLVQLNNGTYLMDDRWVLIRKYL